MPHAAAERERLSLKQLISRAFALTLYLSAAAVTSYAAPLKEDEKQVLMYGAFIMGGVIIYIVAGKLFEKFVKNRKKGKEDK